MVRTWSVSGDTCPTIILLKGKNKCVTFTDEHPVCHSLSPGSITTTIEINVMTNDASHEATKSITNGYNRMFVIRNNPWWDMWRLFDGFVSHGFVMRALDLQAERNIITAKEDSKISRINQSYYQLIDKNDKNIVEDTIASQQVMNRVIKCIAYTQNFDVIIQTPQRLWTKLSIVLVNMLLICLLRMNGLVKSSHLFTVECC